MTDKTRVVAVRLPNEIADWLESDGSARKRIEDVYEERGLDLTEFFRACDKYRIDYQKAVDRMVELIDEH